MREYKRAAGGRGKNGLGGDGLVRVSRGRRALDKVVLLLVREVLERPAIRLREEERREEAGEHEEGENLEDVRDPVVGAGLAADVLEA